MRGSGRGFGLKGGCFGGGSVFFVGPENGGYKKCKHAPVFVRGFFFGFFLVFVSEGILYIKKL